MKSEVKLKTMKLKAIESQKFQKFIPQTYAFVHYKIMDFPPNIKYRNNVLITQEFFENVHRIINTKIHLHHSHVTGEILEYAHDFCNLKVRENQPSFTCLSHNFLKFDMLFLLKQNFQFEIPKI